MPDTAEHTGAMVALVPSEADLDRLALPEGEPRDELHLTLAYLGDAVDIAPEVADALFGYLQEIAAELGAPIVTNAFGVAYWNPSGPEPAWVLNVGDDSEGVGSGLGDAHAAVEEVTENVVPTLPDQHSPWQPHVCIAYSITGIFNDLVQRLGPITFDRLRLALGGDVRDLELGSGGSQAATIRAAAGGDAVPWHKVQNSGDCPSDKPWAVVKDGTGELAGCHANEADADDQLAALYANDGADQADCVDCGGEDVDHFTNRELASDVPWNGAASRFSDDQYKKATAACDAGDGTVKERCFLPHHEPGGALNVNGLHAVASRFSQLSGHGAEAVARAKAHLRSHYGEVGEDVPDVLKAEGAAVTASAPEPVDCGPGYHRMPDGSCMSDAEMETASRWSGVLCVEGTPTGDGREFSPDALDWADHMLLRWQKEGSHGGDHDVTVTVGRIDRAWRDGPLVRGEGALDLMNPDGFEVRRRLAGGFAGGVSIDADDIEDADVELIWPEADAEGEELAEGDDILNMLFGRPLKTVYHGGRVRAATLVDIPAFVEAAISLTGGEGGSETVAASTRSTAVSDAPWAYTIRMHRELPDAAYAWVAADGTSRAFPHHELVDGDLGPANLTACSAAIAKLGVRGALPTPGEVRLAYAHLAQHLRDAGQVPPPMEFGAEALVSSATDDWRPSREWFKNPQLTVPLGTVVTDDGRVYGHIAHWQDCHIGFEDVCVAPPREDSHPYFMTGEVVCADGSRVSVGQVTVGIGHAPSHYRAARATEHYDDTTAVVADVAVGNDEYGIWMAGAIRPHAESRRVHDLRASGRVSGDWRRIGNQLRLVGVLGVNVGGFLMPNLTVRVASGVQTALVAAGIPRVGPPIVTERDLDQRALRLMMDRVAARVRGS